MWICSLLLSIALSCSAAGNHDNQLDAMAQNITTTEPPDQSNADNQAPAAMTMGNTRSPGQSGSAPPLSDLVLNQQPEDAWRMAVQQLLTQLIGIQADILKHQMQMVQQLGMLGTQGAQQIKFLQSLAGHQSLLVENHQALLLQTSRIATQLQDISRKPAAACQ